MAVKASNSITLSSVVDVKATYRYYLLQSSTLAAPSKPTAYPPPSTWDDTEPTYTEGSTNSLYFVDCTVFCDDTFSYSEVSLSSSYEAAKVAYNKAVSAQDTANTATSIAKTHYGTCSTAAGTAAKAVTLSGFSLYTGATVTVYFTYANTASSPTLNVNGTGAKAIRVNGATITAPYYWFAKNTVTFVYDGTYWVMADTSAGNILANWCYENNKALINGAMLALGTVLAKHINVEDLFAQNITATGTITGATLKSAYAEIVKGLIGGFTLADNQLSVEVDGVYINPTEVERDKVQRYLLGYYTMTDTELEASDLDGDGDVDAVDLLNIQKCVLGLANYVDYANAKTSTVKATINPNDPEKLICLSGTNAWGRAFEQYFGVNGINVGNVVADSVKTGSTNTDSMTANAMTASTLHLTSTTDASNSSDNDTALIIGDRSGQHLSIDVNEILPKASGTTAGGLYLGESSNYIYASDCLLAKNTVLWSGSLYMSSSQSATLSKAISKQANGIVLVWSAYINDVTQNYDWWYVFIPKHHVAYHSGTGIDMVNAHTNFAHVVQKYVYVSDTKIAGSAYNTTYGTTNSVTYDNTYYVLRYVIGV